MITSIVLNPAVDKIYFVDGFEPGKLYRVGNVVKSAGGKGINVARVASILGEDVSTIGFKGGETGDWLEAKLRELHVNTEFIPVESDSRTNNNIIDRVNRTETEVLETGPLITSADVAVFLELYKNKLKQTKILVCSGGLPNGIPADFYRTLIEMARPYAIKVILDASNEVLEEGIKAKPYMVKPNLRELSEYVDRQLSGVEDVIGACEDILSMGVDIVVASLGKDGAVLAAKDMILHAKVPEVDAVNTIGSGDSMVAGFAAALTRGYPPEEMFKLGMACATVNTLFMEIGYIEKDLVEKYKNLIDINVLK